MDTQNKHTAFYSVYAEKDIIQEGSIIFQQNNQAVSKCILHEKTEL